jgi:hypothetical protein
MKITQRELIFNTFRINDDIDNALSYIRGLITTNKYVELTECDEKELKLKLFSLRTKFNKRFLKNHRYWPKFETKCSIFLNNEFNFEFKMARKKPVKPRKLKNFNDMCSSRKWMQASKVAQMNAYNSSILLQAALLSAKKEKNVTRVTAIKEILLKKKPKMMPKKIKKVNTDEALELMIRNSLSKSQYINFKQFASRQHANILPHYRLMSLAKKEHYPVNIHVNEQQASVPLKNLIKHTLNGIMDVDQHLIEKKLCELQDKEVHELIFKASYGMDGSSGYSNYNQKYSTISQDTDDSHLFVCSFIPLQLCTIDGDIIWQCPSPSSVRFCRPISMTYSHESDKIVIDTRNELQKQIDELGAFEFELKSAKKLLISSKLILCLIDGKVLKVITETVSYQRCMMCSCTPKDFNVMENWSNGNFTPRDSNLQHGFQELHFKLRSYDSILTLAYKNPKSLQNFSALNQKEAFELNKAEINSNIKTHMGITITNFNEGNIVRRCYEDIDLFAQCLKFDENQKKIIYYFKMLSLCFNSRYNLNATKLKSFCFEIFVFWLENFDYYRMPVTIHKVLVHSADIVRHSIVPPIFMSEEAAESTNKFIRSARKDHARRSSRLLTLEDMFKRRLLESSPALTIKIFENSNKHKLISLPRNVIDLLELSYEERTLLEECSMDADLNDEDEDEDY